MCFIGYSLVQLQSKVNLLLVNDKTSDEFGIYIVRGLLIRFSRSKTTRVKSLNL